MKNLGIIGIAVLGLAVTSCSGTEEQTIEKKIEITDDNGDTQVEITTTEDGVTTEESYSGDEAKKKVKEIEKETKEAEKEIRTSDKPNVKSLDNTKVIEIKKEIKEVDGVRKVNTKELKIESTND